MDDPLEECVKSGDIERLIHHFSAATGMGVILVLHPSRESVTSPVPHGMCARSPSHTACLQKCPALVPEQAPRDRPGILRCSRGLVHAVAPVVVHGQFAGHLAVGPAFLEAPDLERLLQQAEERERNDSGFRDVLRQVPVMTPERMQHALSLLNESIGLCADGRRAARPAPTAGVTPDQAEADAGRAQLLRRAFDCAGVGLVLVDENQRFLEANQTVLATLGYSADELARMTVSDITAPGEPVVARDVPFPNGASSQTMDIEKRYRRKDGSTFWGELTATALPGEAGRYLGIIRDITPRIRADRIRQVQHELGIALCGPMGLDETLRRVLDAALEIAEMECGGVYSVDPRTHALELKCATGLSPEFIASASHYEPDSPSGRVALAGHSLYVDYAQLRTSADPVRLRENLRSIAIIPVLHGGDVVACLNVASRTFQDVPASTREAVEILAGQIGAAIQRARAEEEVRCLNEQLEQRVRERTAQLEATNRELEAFAYSISHDLRAPLRSMDGFSQTLLEDYYDKLDEPGRDYLQRVRRSAQRMGKMIDDILQLSRTSRVEISRERVDLSAVGTQILAQLQEAEPGRIVIATVAPGLVAHTDLHLFQRVLANLLGNAWKFTSGRAQARIELDVLSADAAAAAGHPGEQVYFVRDNGVGFDMAYVGKLFGMFQRLHSMEAFPGTGIGLAMVQRIVRRMGGDVWGEGAVDRGATFYFTIPD